MNACRSKQQQKQKQKLKQKLKQVSDSYHWLNDNDCNEGGTLTLVISILNVYKQQK